MMGKLKKKNRGIILIKKANNLIESRYKFDIWETRFFLSILAQIRREDEDFQVYRIWYKDVIKAFELKSGDSYKYLRDAAQNLMAKSFFVSYEEDGVKREKQYHILREIDYLQEGQEGKAYENHEFIDVTVESRMRPLLLQLQKNFTAYDLRNIVRLGVYPVRVYELLKQYEKIGKRTLEVEEMKIMFEVTERYRLFADFFRWVIKPAVKEINKHTDLTISKVEKLKRGRKVAALRFTFHVKKRDELKTARGESIQQELKLDFLKDKDGVGGQAIPIPADTTEKNKRFDKFFPDVVERFGVTPSVFLELLGSYSETQVEQAIRVTNRAKYLQLIKTNIAGFFIKALKDGYTDPKEEAQKRKPLKEKQMDLYKVQPDKLQQQIEELEQEKAMRINDRIKEVVIEQPDITGRAIQILKEGKVEKIFIARKEKELGRSLVLEDYREDRLLRESVKNKIVALARNRFEDIINDFEMKLAALSNK